MNHLAWLVVLGVIAMQDPPKKEAPAAGQDPKKEETPAKKEEAPAKQETPAKKEEAPKKKEDPVVLVKLNEVRKAYALPAVVEDEALSTACKKHADYLMRNNPTGNKENRHDENPKNAAFSPEGKKAAPNSLIGFDGVEKAVDYWMATFIQRAQILDPGVSKVGFGQAGRICVLDVHSARTDADFEPIVTPYPNEDKVETRYGFGGDDPDALPRNAKLSEVGNPITVLFPSKARVRGIQWSLKDKQNRGVQCHTSTPEAVGVKHERVVSHAIALIPKAHLAPNTVYTARVSCVVDGKNFEKTWSFTTAR